MTLAPRTIAERTVADRGGFTLLEMLIALAILSLATIGVGYAAPGFQQRLELRQATARLDAMLIKARTEALGGAGAATIRFDPEKRALELPSQKIVYRLPAGVELSIVGGAFGDNPRAPSIAFLSDGSSTGGVIELRSGAFRSVRRIGWLTGRIDKDPFQ